MVGQILLQQSQIAFVLDQSHRMFLVPRVLDDHIAPTPLAAVFFNRRHYLARAHDTSSELADDWNRRT